MLGRMRGALQRRVGANVRAIRVAAGVTQEAFGQRIGMDRAYLGKIERGERNLSLQLVEDLAERLEVSTDQLLASGDR